MRPSTELQNAILAYRAGNSEEFTFIYENSKRYVYQCIRTVIKGWENEHDIIQDIMQDTYLEMTKYIQQLKDTEKFLSWLGTISTRKCYLYIERNKKYVLMQEEDTTFEQLADEENIIPEDLMQNKEKQRLLREIIEKQLSEMQKLCIIEYYFNDRKQSEIAEVLGIPENTVKTNLSRAKRKIREGVIELETNKDTKLYSVGPFLVLLMEGALHNCIVPEAYGSSIVAAVTSSTTAQTAGAATAIVEKHTAGVTAMKAATIGRHAAKGKIIAAILGVAAVSVTTVGIIKMKTENKHKEPEVVQMSTAPTPTNEAQLEKEEEKTIQVTDQEKKTLKTLSKAVIEALSNSGEKLEGKTFAPDKKNIEQILFTYFIQQELGSTTLEELKCYAKETFNVEIKKEDIERQFMVQDAGYYPLGMDNVYGSLCNVEKVEQKEDEIAVSGTFTEGELLGAYTYPSYNATYEFKMNVQHNEKSPLGFSLKNISFESSNKHPYDIKQNGYMKYYEFLSEPDKYSELLPTNRIDEANRSMTYGPDVKNVFCFVDLDHDGNDEMIYGISDTRQVDFIWNILKYDVEKNKLVELAPGTAYGVLQSGFEIYDTGIMCTDAEISNNETLFINTLTGESYFGYQKTSNENDETPVNTHDSYLEGSDQKVYSGKEGTEKYKELSSGTPYNLVWNDTLEDTMEQVILSKVTPVSELQNTSETKDEKKESSTRTYLKDCKVTASSTLTGGDYKVGNLTDGDYTTAWVEGAEGDGIGESLTFETNGKEVSGFAILPGFFISSRLYERNARPTYVDVKIDGIQKRYCVKPATINIENPKESFVYIDFEKTYTPKKVEIMIAKADKGSKYEDTCISELHLYK